MSNETESKKKIAPQVFITSITPRQRFELVRLISSAVEPIIKGADERNKMKRFREAFGLAAIFEAASETGSVNSTLASSKTPSAFTLTIENVEFLLSSILERLALSGPQAQLLEPLIDELEAFVAGNSVEVPTDQPFDPSAEDWTPPKPAEKTAG